MTVEDNELPAAGQAEPVPGQLKPSPYRRPPVAWVAHRMRSGATFAEASSLLAGETTASCRC